jgi:hypothetical protein
MRAALTDPRYFGEALAGDSWANWRVLLIAIAGEALNPDELAVFKALTNRQKAPVEPFAEFWGIIRPQGREEPGHGRPGRVSGRLQRLQAYSCAGWAGAGSNPFRDPRSGGQPVQLRLRRLRIIEGIARPYRLQNGWYACAQEFRVKIRALIWYDKAFLLQKLRAKLDR